MKRISIIYLFLTIFTTHHIVGQNYRLHVSSNKRYIVKADNTPFFYLGDTGWELFHRLDREKATTYLTDRANKGFTVIQAVVLAELDGLHTPNPYGQLPLIDDDPLLPNEEYFKHVDFIVNKAAELGLYIGMLPTWGDKIFKNTWGIGPEIFDERNARIFGEFLGDRYKDKPIIWIIGGDRNPRENSDDVAIWRSLARGIVDGVGSNDDALLTFHPQPLNSGSSSNWFHNEDWLDFNMHQTGHCRDARIAELINQDYQKQPYKPTLNGEPIYEDHPVCFDAPKNGYTSPFDVRKAAYISLFSGAFGHTYGCHNVWQMWEPSLEKVNGPLKPWYESLDLPGAMQMKFVRSLMESRPVKDRFVDQSILINSELLNNTVAAIRGKDYFFVYTTNGKPFSVNLGKITGERIKVYWYNPRTGKITFWGETPNNGLKTFTPPISGFDSDWILIADDSKTTYPLPKAD